MRNSWVTCLACAAIAAIPSTAHGGDRDADPGRTVPTQLTMFVTSTSGSGDLSTWADSGSQDGLAGADAICRARAAAATLPNASLYVAWMSDASDDAYCRVHQMSGQRATNCGGFPDPPTFAGPWMRTDGEPFAARIHIATGFNGVVYSPPLLDEYGDPVTANAIFTATDFYGVYDGGTSAGCSTWSSDSGMVPCGSLTRTTISFTDAGNGGCIGPSAILCLLPLEGLELPPPANQGALAFVTSPTGHGRLQDWAEAGGQVGVAAGDNICMLRAIGSNLPHPESFKAFLSVGGANAADRFTFSGPWVRPDGMVVAATKAELLSGQLQAPINQTGGGEYWGNLGVWTGSSSDGTTSGFDCGGWTSDLGTDSGTAGAANAIDVWSDAYTTSGCNGWAALYCLADMPNAVRIFLDNFETGDPSRWSAVTP